MKKLSPTTTAKEAFDAQRIVLASIQKRLDTRLVVYAAEFAETGSRDWSYVETEKETIKSLAIALALLGDRSAVDELGIGY